MKGRSAIKTGAPEVFEGMNERFVPVRHNDDLVDLRANEPLAGWESMVTIMASIKNR